MAILLKSQSNETEDELKNFCKTNSTCKNAGEILVIYTEENSDSMAYYGAEYMVYDYNNLIYLKGDFEAKLTTKQIEEINEDYILSNLEEQKKRNTDKDTIPF